MLNKISFPFQFSFQFYKLLFRFMFRNSNYENYCNKICVGRGLVLFLLMSLLIWIQLKWLLYGLNTPRIFQQSSGTCKYAHSLWLLTIFTPENWFEIDYVFINVIYWPSCISENLYSDFSKNFNIYLILNKY